jgi:STE24 endopeptidase
MMETNPWFWLALIATVGLYKLELLATMLNLSALSPTVPEKLRPQVDDERHERALEYARRTAKTGVVEASTQLGIFLTFWWGGGFSWMDGWIRGTGLDPILAGLAVFGLYFLAQSLLALPFDLYDTFVVEAEFGFNKTTPATFLGDRIKGLALGAILGLPLLAFILWLFMHVELAALYAWLTLTAFSLLISFLSPRLILPLFYKFQPLPDESLRQAIMELSRKLGFPVAEVSLVDGSRRSSKANAFFTGFGKLKRIALFDTLVQNHSREEILAVLAHEIGHSKRKHVPRQMALSLVTSALMFLLLHLSIHDPRMTAAFGVAGPSVAWSLLFFTIMYQPMSTLTGLVGGWLSRKYEFEADAYAKEAMGGPQPLVSALSRLSSDHLSNPTPHPFYVFLHYSHPPLLERLAALEK